MIDYHVYLYNPATTPPQYIHLGQHNLPFFIKKEEGIILSNKIYGVLSVGTTDRDGENERAIFVQSLNIEIIHNN